MNRLRLVWRRLWETRTGRLVLPVLLTAVSMALRTAMIPWLGSRAPYMFFFPVVLVCAWWGGRLSGLTAVAASALASVFLCHRSGPSPSPALGDWLMTGFYVLVATAIAFAAHSARALRAAQPGGGQQDARHPRPDDGRVRRSRPGFPVRVPECEGYRALRHAAREAHRTRRAAAVRRSGRGDGEDRSACSSTASPTSTRSTTRPTTGGTSSARSPSARAPACSSWTSPIASATRRRSARAARC